MSINTDNDTVVSLQLRRNNVWFIENLALLCAVQSWRLTAWPRKFLFFVFFLSLKQSESRSISHNVTRQVVPSVAHLLQLCLCATQKQDFLNNLFTLVDCPFQKHVFTQTGSRCENPPPPHTHTHTHTPPRARARARALTHTHTHTNTHTHTHNNDLFQKSIAEFCTEFR